MKVAYFTGPRQLEIREEAEPRLTGRDDVLVRIDRVGVCGSDVHYYTEGGIGHMRLAYPATLGHECAGTIVDVGPDVVTLSPGDRVAIDPAFICGTCDQCRAGRVNTCRQIQFMGSPGQAPGAVAEYRVLPAGNCLPIPDNVTLEEAALVEPLSVGLYAARLGEVYPAARVAIFGAGPIGLSVLLCTKATAPCTVYMTDLLDERLAVARQCGADWTGNAVGPSALEAIAKQEPWGLDIVFECSGDPACIDQAQQLLTPGGTLVLVGIPSTVHVAFDIHTMRTKELTFKNVRRQKGCVAPAIRLIADRHIDVAPMLTHAFPLARLGDAFELVAGYRDGVIKAMIDVSP
jgi:L-iditol 2-dehydrogenase